VSAWGLRPDEVEALFGEATPLDGHPKLLRPSPHHALLVLARLGVTPKRRARFVDALAVPGARAEAERRAHLWGVTLDSVERRPPPRVLPPRVVALSGLDGSGKSTQTRALQSALEALGYRVHVEWAPILQNRSIETLSRLARVVLRRGAGHAVAGGRSIVAQADATTVSRRALRAGWTSLVALVNGWSHRRPVLAHRGSQTVVVYDRFVLDSTVRIRFLYGRDERFGPQRTLLRALSPRPVAAFWLDVPPERAYARKPEHWDVDDLTTQRELYAQEHAGFGVRRLDGELPPDELAAAIARDVWLAL
jgi:thymidylate kinase